MKKFTKLIAAFALLVFMAPTMVGWGQTRTEVEVTWTASEQGYENATDVTDITIDDNISGTFAKASGTNAPKYYTNGSSVRMYNGNTLAITPGSDAEITEIEFTLSQSGGFTVSSGEYSVEELTGTWTGSSTEAIVFTNGSAQNRIQVIKVTYITSGTPAVTHTLTFSADPVEGGTVTVGSNTTGTISLAENATSTVTATPNTGYVFNNWTVTGIGSSVAEASSASTTFTMGTEDASLAANFTAVTTYTVTYKANGPEGIADVVETYNEGATVTVAANTFNYSGHVFVKWNTEETGLGTDYNPDDVIESISFNIDLYAQWEESSETVDVLDWVATGSPTNYTDWTYTGTSGAEYAGQSSGNATGQYIQLRSNNDNSGIVTTTSVGMVTKVAVVWNSSTANGRTLNVYGKNTAYSAATDLYDDNAGTLIGTIVYGTSTELSITDDYAFIGLRSASGAMYLNEIDITWTPDSNPAVATIVTIDATNLTNTDIYSGTEAGSLSATVSTISGEPVNGAVVTWTSSNEEVATIDENGVVTLVAAGSTTITASYAGVEEEYRPSSATHELVVTNSDPNIPGTQNNPYTVAQARAAIDAGTGTQGVYATGIVSEIVTAFNPQYGNISYNISSDGLTTSDQLQSYRGKSYNGEDFTSADDIQVGDIVVIYGDLKKYNSIYEFDSDNQLVSLVRPERVATPTFTPEAGVYAAVQSVAIACETEDATIYYTLDGEDPTTESTVYSEAITVSETTTIKALAVKEGLLNSFVATAVYTIEIPVPTITIDPISLTASEGSGTIDVVYSDFTPFVANQPSLYVDEECTTEFADDWIIVEFAQIEEEDDYYHIDYVVGENTGEERTVYMKVEVMDEEEQEIYTVVAITQAAPIIDYAELPFEFDGGRADIATTNGLTQEGLGSDYTSSPKLKFDSTDDWMILKINEEPGLFSFKIKGTGSSWSGTFDVQTSVDGVNYESIATYDSLGDTETKTFDNLDADVRYIRWYFTEKVSGCNVGIGDIKLEKVDNNPSITLSTYEIDVDAEEHDSTIMVVYKNVDFTNIPEIQFFSQDGVTSSSQPDWITTAEIDANYNVHIVIAANTVETARGAFFKVYGLDAEANDVYSDLVTVTQAAYVAPPVPGNWVLTSLADLAPGDVFVIVGDNGDTYAMPNDNGTSTAPAAVEVTVVDGTLSEEPAANLQWNISITDEGYIFYPNNDTTTWLYCTNTNNGVRVGTNENKVFTVSENGYLNNIATGRYIGIYSSQDWRCYTSEGGNIADQTFAFYKKVSSGTNAQTVALNAGVNWVSFYVDISLSALQGALVTALPGATLIRITAQNGSATTYNGTRWRGSLNSAAWDVSRMYTIEIQSDAELSLEGEPVDPAGHSINIAPGNNWIGFPLGTGMTVSDAFAGFAIPNDKVNAQNGKNTTYNGTRWRGTMTTLEPGQGYVFYGAGTESRPFVYPTPSKRVVGESGGKPSLDIPQMLEISKKVKSAAPQKGAFEARIKQGK